MQEKALPETEGPLYFYPAAKIILKKRPAGKAGLKIKSCGYNYFFFGVVLSRRSHISAFTIFRICSVFSI